MFRHLILPDLDLGGQPVVLSLWLVKRGERVTAGESIAEVLAGPVIVDLPATADGILVEKLVAEGERIAAGQQLAVIDGEIGPARPAAP
jgi:pyruvate/2-oxoglutarate dehydrogenase complex dihydrolipoamide acyltransferase (E2) component